MVGAGGFEPPTKGVQEGRSPFLINFPYLLYQLFCLFQRLSFFFTKTTLYLCYQLFCLF